MNPDWIAAAIIATFAAALYAWGKLREASETVDRLIADAIEPRPATDTPIHDALVAESDMGPILAAGYERQAKRLAAELDDDAALDAWLRGAS